MPAHRKFARCGQCDGDIARWEDGETWWHLDGNVAHDHPATPENNQNAR